MPEGIGYATPNVQGQAPTQAPPAVQTSQAPAGAPQQPQQQSNQQAWYQKLLDIRNDPAAAMMLFQMGSAIAAGPNYGQNVASQIIGGINEGLQYRGRVGEAQRQREIQDEQRELERQEAERKRRESESQLQTEQAQRAASQTSQELARAKDAREAGREPFTRNRLAAETEHFKRRAANEGRGGVKGMQLAQLASALYNEQRDKYPTLDAAYIRASEMIETNLTRDKFIADVLKENAVLYKSPEEARQNANDMADIVFGAQTQSAPAATTATNVAPIPQSLMDNANVWKRVAKSERARAEAEARFGKEAVDAMIRLHGE